jgi:hypothetical protein
MKLPVLAPGDLTGFKDLSPHQRTPLRFYLLREADVTEDGERLGPVGGRIVAEVILGGLDACLRNWRGVHHGRPALRRGSRGSDLLTSRRRDSHHCSRGR